MEAVFYIDPSLDVPLYRQLVDRIQTAIKTGKLTAGEKLPTVQEMSENLSIARGTIKRAYDELERKGLLEKVQGRGTFVCYQPSNSGSRKEQAMAAIDEMLNRLEEMGFSPAEINIFLNLKLRQRAEQESRVKVVAVECNPENLEQMAQQLRGLEGVDLYTYLLEDLLQYPYRLGDDFDLLVTTPSHADYLQSILPVKKRLARAALRPADACLRQIIRLNPGAEVGIVGYSPRFTELMQEACETYAEDVCLHDPLAFAQERDLEGYLQGKDAVLVPQHYDRFFGTEERELLDGFSGKLIRCHYEMDEGSLIYLENKIKRLLDAKVL